MGAPSAVVIVVVMRGIKGKLSVRCYKKMLCITIIDTIIHHIQTNYTNDAYM
jgi:hypothetical protein